MHKIWLLKLVLPIRYGRTLTGLLLLILLLPLFYLGASRNDGVTTPALFFSLIFAYIIPVFSFITMKAQEALRALRPILDIDDVEFNEVYRHLDSARSRHILAWLCGGALAGCVHLSFIRGSVSAVFSELLSSVAGAVTTGGALMVWVVMTTVIAMLLQQALIFARMGGGVARVSLLDTRTLLPFARVSINSSLAVIGALALFPLINLEGGLNLTESVPGVVSILGPLVIMFIIPVWPLHQRLAMLKRQELTGLLDRITVLLDGADGNHRTAGEIDRLLPLLTYRREVVQLSTWPFDLGNITTLAFYLIIPPLTWTGAALIENLVNYIL